MKQRIDKEMNGINHGNVRCDFNNSLIIYIVEKIIFILKYNITKIIKYLLFLL